MVERGAKLSGAAGDALVEGVDVVAHCLGDVLGALAETFDQFTAVSLHGIVEFGDVARDQAAERGGIARDLLGQRGAAGAEHLVEGLEARRQHVLDGVAAVVERGDELLGVGVEGVRNRVAAVDDGVGDAGAGLLNLGDDVAAAQRDVQHQRIAGGAQRRVDLVGASGNRIRHMLAGVGDCRAELLGARRHLLDGDGGLLREALRHLIEPRRHHLLQAGGEVGEFVVHVLGLEGQARRQAVAGRTDGGGGLVAGALEAVEQRRTALAQGVDHGIAGVAERERNVLALFGERTGDALRHFVDLVGDQIADRGDVVGEIEMHAGNGVANLLGLRDQRFALIGQFAEQIADAHFVVIIGALQRRDFVVHQSFEFGGARQSTLDAVAHGGDFAADGLADRNNRLARGGLRLGQTHGDFRHGFGDQPHVLRAAEHVGNDVEEDHRHHDGADGADPGGGAERRHGQHGHQFIGNQKGNGDASGGPDRGGDSGRDIRCARRAAAQRLQNLSDIGAVVIGGAARRIVVAIPGRGRGFFVKQIGGERWA